MTGTENAHPQIIGLTGSFGSGCTYVAGNILSSEYEFASLSEILKKLYKQEHGRKHTRRRQLQDFGDELRRTRGDDYLAKEAIAQIKKSDKIKWVVDSIRNPAEIYALRESIRDFYLIGMFADKELRWKRVRDGYKNDRNAFEADDHKDTGKDSPSNGQRVSDCFYEADIVFRNEKDFSAIGNIDFQEFSNRLYQYVTLVQSPLTNRQVTRPDEAIMAMAYAASQRSSCPQRKVGAVITDGTGNIISSGFNEVPPGEKPCIDEYKVCYRALERKNFMTYLRKTIKGFGTEYEETVGAEFKSRFRVMDICRALHAEENAILNLARHGRSGLAEEFTLYTTTYPCRLCANKISQLGIKRVVYLEPYPDEPAKAILNESDVTTEFFEGITFRAYFRVYGDKR